MEQTVIQKQSVSEHTNCGFQDISKWINCQHIQVKNKKAIRITLHPVLASIKGNAFLGLFRCEPTINNRLILVFNTRINGKALRILSRKTVKYAFLLIGSHSSISRTY